MKVDLIRVGIVRWGWLIEKGCCDGILMERIARKFFVQLICRNCFVGILDKKKRVQGIDPDTPVLVTPAANLADFDMVTLFLDLQKFSQRAPIGFEFIDLALCRITQGNSHQ